jgi:hypothetical protein
LPVEYFHVVFTIPAQINDIACQNKKVLYDILFKAVTKTLTLIAGDKKHLGARLGATLVLHTWGSAMTHHPHIHCIIPGGGLTADGKQWIKCKPGYFLPVPVLSLLFRRLFLKMLYQAYLNQELQFFGKLKMIANEKHFFYWIKPLKKKSWHVYAKKPFAGPTLTYPDTPTVLPLQIVASLGSKIIRSLLNTKTIAKKVKSNSKK